MSNSVAKKNTFSNFQSVSKKIQTRPLALFGGSEIAAKTRRKLGTQPAYIFDNSPNMWGHEEDGVVIQKPDVIATLQEVPFIVICTTSFAAVTEQLESIGLKPDVDFLVSPVLNDLRVITEMDSLHTSFLLSSGAPPNEDPATGGGIYEVTVSGVKHSYEKVHSGSCHSIIYVGDVIYTVDDSLGIIEFDDNYNVVRSGVLPQGSRGHGLSYEPMSKTFFVACSYLDKVLRYDNDFQIIQEYPLSFKASNDDMPAHHTNDCLVVGNSLYVSMFSETGNWKRDIFDGAIVEFEISSGLKNGSPISNLWMPHNILFIDGSLTVCDSLRGGLLKNNSQEVGRFPGFTRGLGHDGVYFYVGQSRNRNFSKNIGISNNISLDTSVIIFDEVTKVSRTLHLPTTISEVHGILCIEK